jgi:predicted dehydrogenase
VNVVVVATPHKYLAEVSQAALQAGKIVFCEKPGARRAVEMEPVLDALGPSWRSTGTVPATRMVIGFTLRHHPAISRARRLVAEGVIGEPMFIRAHYGHGGRPGYNYEWRGNVDLSGGGELVDQGVHLIDLGRWFLGEFTSVSGVVGTFFWGKDAELERQLDDNAFLLLQTATARVASLHASWTQWKNAFLFEIFGKEGSLHISGLGRHYGVEKLVIHRRHSDGGTPSSEEMVLGDAERVVEEVWAREWDGFVGSVLGDAELTDMENRCNCATAIDAWHALRVVDAAYANRHDIEKTLAPNLATAVTRA